VRVTLIGSDAEECAVSQSGQSSESSESSRSTPNGERGGGAGRPRTIALVLAGAVAQGAFEVGVIRALVRTDVRIVRIVATSSGALNGTVLAAALRRREPIAGGETLAELWRDHASWSEVFHVSLRDLLRRDGLADQKRLLGLLRDSIPAGPVADPAPINLRMIVAALRGCQGAIGAHPATTFESVRDFDGEDFATAAGLERVFTAAVASAAFPLVFAPVEIDGIGPCVDGGAVNNTPMKWALDGPVGAGIDAVVVVSTSVERRTAAPDVSGLAPLAGHLAGMLVEERLYRDLREYAETNAGLTALDRMVADGKLTPALLDEIKQALGLADRRAVDIVCIRPSSELRGSAFAGFFDAELRREYLDIGYDRGLAVLAQAGWPHRPAQPSVRHDDLVATAPDPVVLPGAIEGDRAE
jgi:predicted acylesterase/phospholipase RssA